MLAANESGAQRRASVPFSMVARFLLDFGDEPSDSPSNLVLREMSPAWERSQLDRLLGGKVAARMGDAIPPRSEFESAIEPESAQRLAFCKCVDAMDSRLRPCLASAAVRQDVGPATVRPPLRSRDRLITPAEDTLTWLWRLRGLARQVGLRKHMNQPRLLRVDWAQEEVKVIGHEMKTMDLHLREPLGTPQDADDDGVVLVIRAQEASGLQGSDGYLDDRFGRDEANRARHDNKDAERSRNLRSGSLSGIVRTITWHLSGQHLSGLAALHPVQVPHQ